MATEISAIGKQALMSRLFEGSGFVNGRGCAFSGDGDFGTVHKVFMEKVDFDLTYNPLRHLGHKLALNVIGELYAGMYSPVGMDVVVALSNRFSAEDVQDLWEGVTAAAKEHGVRHLSFDLVPSAAGMVVSIAAYGSAGKEVAQKRKKAQSKDLLVLSGDLGAAYMGLHVLVQIHCRRIPQPLHQAGYSGTFLRGGCGSVRRMFRQQGPRGSGQAHSR